MRLVFRLTLSLCLGAAVLNGPAPVSAAGSTVYLPVVTRSYDPLATTRRVNAPFFNVADITGQKFSEMAIFWFGRVGPTENYTDVRVAYNTTELVVYAAIFDRRLWYDTTPSASDLTQWDSVSVYLNLTGNAGGAPTTSAYRFVAQLTNGGTLPAGSKASYRGNGSAWGAQAITFTASSGWRGDVINDNTNDRGWAMTFRIPFSSLGVSAPAQGAAPWGLAVVVHDRDEAGGTPIADQAWPANTLDLNGPSTWGQLRWGLPAYTPPPSTPGGAVTIRHKLNGAVVPDADVGGALANQCPGDENYIWNSWGNANYGANTGLNIQNQDDIADWPCFAKLYITFPLTGVPADKVIRSATLTLHQTGGSGPSSNGDPPTDQYIQVLSVNQDWSEGSITWNNAPLAVENFSGSWVGTVVGCGGSIAWPCVPRTWNVTALVAQAYASQTPARLILYSANTGYGTGKHFTSSNAEDWNAVGRPTLTVEWGHP